MRTAEIPGVGICLLVVITQKWQFLSEQFSVSINVDYEQNVKDKPIITG
jgi:hypothetical protein